MILTRQRPGSQAGVERHEQPFEQRHHIPARLNRNQLHPAGELDRDVDLARDQALHGIGHRHSETTRLARGAHARNRRHARARLGDAHDERLAGALRRERRKAHVDEARGNFGNGKHLRQTLETRRDIKRGIVAGAGTDEIYLLDLVRGEQVAHGSTELFTAGKRIAQRTALIAHIAHHARRFLHQI